MVPVDGHQLVVTRNERCLAMQRVTNAHKFQCTNISQDLCPGLEYIFPMISLFLKLFAALVVIQYSSLETQAGKCDN